MCRVVVSLIKPIAFLTFSLWSLSYFPKVHNYYGFFLPLNTMTKVVKMSYTSISEVFSRMSLANQSTCWPTIRQPLYRLTNWLRHYRCISRLIHRPSVGQYINRYIGCVLVDIIWLTCRLICRPRGAQITQDPVTYLPYPCGRLNFLNRNQLTIDCTPLKKEGN